jgi:hypothetical protein
MVLEHAKSPIPWCYNQFLAFSDLHLVNSRGMGKPRGFYEGYTGVWVGTEFETPQKPLPWARGTGQVFGL